MITYEMLISDEMIDGVTAISLVDEPAIMSNFVLLKKENSIKLELNEYKLADKRLRLVTGLVLIPDLVIPRNGYNIVFSKDTVRKISENFMINNYKDNVTVQHKVSVNKVNLVESWIVENKTKDKTSALGIEAPVGSWAVSFKINDEDLWQEYLSTNVLRGFSLEGQFTEKEVNMSSVEKLSKDDKEVHELYLALNYSPADLESYYVWKLGAKINHCPSCIANNNQVKKLKDWINWAVPATPNGTIIAGLSTSYPHSPYGTFCEDACDCTLTKVTVKRNIVKPF